LIQRIVNAADGLHNVILLYKRVMVIAGETVIVLLDSHAFQEPVVFSDLSTKETNSVLAIVVALIYVVPKRI
jgi:hypothetical protein